LKDSTLIKCQAFIDGAWLEAKSGETFVVTSPYPSSLQIGGVLLMDCSSLLPDPATNEVLGNIPEMGLTETTAAIQAAAKAFVGWSKTTAKVWPQNLN